MKRTDFSHQDPQAGPASKEAWGANRTHAIGDGGRGRPPYFPDPDTVALAMEIGHVGVWCWDLGTNEVTWSSNIETIHALPRGGFDGSYSFVHDEVHPDDRAAVAAAIDATLRNNEPYRVQYRLRPRPGYEEERWVEGVGTAVCEGGKPVRMVGICRDVTERVQSDRELRVRAAQQHAVARLGERALTAADLQSFLEEVVTTMAEALDVEMVKVLELVPGDAELVLRAGVGWESEQIGVMHVPTGPESHAGHALRHGGPVVVENLDTETRFSGSSLLHERGVVAGITTVIAGTDGRAYGVLGVHTRRRRKFAENDVSFMNSCAAVIAGVIQHRLLDQRHELMIRELRHRSGNLFSQLLALFSQTAKTSRSIADLATKYEARVLALANAHRLVTEGGWKSTSLDGLLRTLLAPYLERTTLDGPDVFLAPDPAFGLSTAIHELATNASKHGGLSEPGGRLSVSWTVQRQETGLTLLLDWTETGGPPPKRAPRKGFGSRLMGMVIERQLNGAVTQSYDQAGLRAHLRVPLTHERWPQPVPPPD